MLVIFIGLLAAGWLVTQLPLPDDTQTKPAGEAKVILGHNGVHVDFVFHRKDFFPAAPAPLLAYAQLFPNQDWIAIGWGDANFLLWHPTWDSVTFSDLWQAGFASQGSALRLTFSDQPWGHEQAPLLLNPVQEQMLMQHFARTLGPTPQVLRLDEKSRELILTSPLDYSLLYTCNDWVADILRSMAQKTPWVVTNSASIMRYY